MGHSQYISIKILKFSIFHKNGASSESIFRFILLLLKYWKFIVRRKVSLFSCDDKFHWFCYGPYMSVGRKNCVAWI